MEVSSESTVVPTNGRWRESILLSILIASVPERIGSLAMLLKEVTRQTLGKPVEVLVITDNRMMSIGEKRQRLNELAKGKYVVHVDDDDVIADDYVDLLLERVVEDKYDCINYICMVQGDDGKSPVPCFYSKNFNYTNYKSHYLRKPNCRCCYRRSLALQHPFLFWSFQEDDEWAKRASTGIHHEVDIAKPLYFYKYITKPKEWFTSRGTIHIHIQQQQEPSASLDKDKEPNPSEISSKDTETHA